jgi:hypothetical protein
MAGTATKALLGVGFNRGEVVSQSPLRLIVNLLGRLGLTSRFAQKSKFLWPMLRSPDHDHQ